MAIPITNIPAEDLSIIGIHLNNDTREMTIEYHGGYEENYLNTILLNFSNFTYESTISDPEKAELAKVFNKLWLKFKFNKHLYRQFNIIDLWDNIKSGVDRIKTMFYTKNISSGLKSLIKRTADFCEGIGNIKICALSTEFNNCNHALIDTIINSYYELYLMYSYKIFIPLTLRNEKDTGYNELWDRFFELMLGREDIDDYYDEAETLVENNVDEQTIRTYLQFARTFVFQITNDLNCCFEDEEENAEEEENIEEESIEKEDNTNDKEEKINHKSEK